MSIWYLVPINLFFVILLIRISALKKEIESLKNNIKHIEEYLKKSRESGF